MCASHKIELLPSWIPREDNETADFISKLSDTDNWGIDYETFAFIEARYGKFTIDRFADNLNKKVEVFNSKFYCPFTSGVNAFTFDWSNHFNWLCPPVNLIGDTINHLKLCKGKAVLLVPMWQSSYFWPLLTSDGEYFNDFVIDFILLDPCFYNNTSMRSVFDGFAKFKTLALLLQF